jgi:hypothetical protein
MPRPDPIMERLAKQANAQQAVEQLFGDYVRLFRTEGVAARVLNCVADNVEACGVGFASGHLDAATNAMIVQTLRQRAVAVIAREILESTPVQAGEQPKGG